MSTAHLLDPELQPLLELPAARFSDEGMPKLRQLLSQRDTLGDAERHGVAREEISFSSADGSLVSALLYHPPTSAIQKPGYLHIHGGGYIVGSAKQADITNLLICAKLNAVVVSVDYRLAPEHSIPAPLDDCYAGLSWLHQHAGELGVDPARIAIGGESAGGGLAAALAIKARDAGEFAICHQHLTYPMLDNLTGSEFAPGDPLVGEFVWTRESNAYGWRSYLGSAPAEAPQVPARVADCAGLPSAWIFTAGLDLFRDENIAYAQRLLAAGVAAELLLYPSACHGFQQLPGTKLGARFAADHLAGLARGLQVELGG